MQKWLSAGVALAILLVSGCSSKPVDKTASVKPVEFKRSEVTILYQSNRFGTVVPCGCEVSPFGGLDREANAVRAIRKADKNVLYVDAGNLFLRAPFKGKIGYFRQKAEMITTMLNSIGLDAFAPGPSDYALGVDFLKTLSAKAKFPFISTNVVDSSGKPVFKPYVIEKRGDINYALISLTPASEMASSGLKVESNDEALKKWLPEVQSKSDVVILLSQVGNPKDMELAKLDGINVIVGGDKSLSLDEAIWLHHGKTLLVETANNGYWLGQLSVMFKLPFKGFQSPEQIAVNLKEIAQLQKESKNAPSDQKLAAYVESKKKNTQLYLIPGGSDYANSLISLDKERFGKPNEITAMLRKEKEKLEAKRSVNR